PPFTEGPVGVWVSEDPQLFQLRARTQRNPNPLTVVPAEIAVQVLYGRAPNHIYNELQPGGTTYLGHNDLVELLPQKFAWNVIQAEVAKLFKFRILDESNSPLILEDRIWHTLLNYPDMWAFGEEESIGQKYLNLLGFETPQAAASAPIGLLLA